MITCQKTISINVVGLPPADAYWRMDEAGNVTRVDHIKGLALGILAGTAPSIAGVISNGANLPTGPRAQLFGDIFNPFGGTAWSALTYPVGVGASVSVWVKYGAVLGAGLWEADFTFQDAGGVILGGFTLRAQAPVTDFEIDYLKHFGAVDASAALGAVTTGAWHHVVLTYTQATKVGSSYVDGIHIFDTPLATSWAAATNAGVNLENNAYYDVGVDELGIWTNHVLSQAEVTTLFNSGSAMRPPNG